MERQRQETVARLQADGVFEMNRELELPVVIQRLAVVSSRNAAGYQDFCNDFPTVFTGLKLLLSECLYAGAALKIRSSRLWVRLPTVPTISMQW